MNEPTMNVSSASIEVVDDAGSDNLPVDAPSALHMIDFDTVQTLEDAILILKTAQLGVFSDNPHFQEIRYLLVNQGGEIDA